MLLSSLCVCAPLLQGAEAPKWPRSIGLRYTALGQCVEFHQTQSAILRSQQGVRSMCVCSSCVGKVGLPHTKMPRKEQLHYQDAWRTSPARI